MLSATARAPAKLVLTGEYAVLFGAPAIVLAIDRHVVVEIAPRADEQWSLTAPGLTASPDRFTLASGTVRWSESASAARWQLASAVLNAAGLEQGPGADIVIDSQALYHGDRKLGVGSSAAVCVALGRALNIAAGAGFDLGALARLHRSLQDGRGSGVDIAASWHGGLCEVTSHANGPDVRPLPEPAPALLRLVDIGHAQSTPRMLERLERWRAVTDDADAHIGALCTAAEQAARQWQAGDGTLATADYAHALAVFDGVTGLGIVSPAHQRVAALADAGGVAYKPSGAGGGDVGVAVADDANALARFEQAASAAGYRVWPVTTGRAEAA